MCFSSCRSSPSITSSPFERFDAKTPSTPKLSSTYLKNRINTDHSLWATYSPKDAFSPLKSPMMKSKSTPTRNTEAGFTPTSSPASSSGSQNLTDNLLKLNVLKRPEAADFFS